MAREPVQRDRRYRTSVGAPQDLTAAVETPTEPYPLKQGGRAVPDRSQPPRIGAACADTDCTSPAVASTEELRSGVEFGSTRGNSEQTQKTFAENVDALREARGIRTRPPRPGRGWIE
jgi:hypothetical protein